VLGLPATPLEEKGIGFFLQGRTTGVGVKLVNQVGQTVQDFDVEGVKLFKVGGQTGQPKMGNP
jgi:hypothetical protein|tara:strand:- start:143 stop:331 length:189 start_codon:yes stop_codon:yes gene_type:complete